MVGRDEGNDGESFAQPHVVCQEEVPIPFQPVTNSVTLKGHQAVPKARLNQWLLAFGANIQTGRVKDAFFL